MPRKHAFAVAGAPDGERRAVLREFSDLPILDIKILKGLEKELTPQGLRSYLRFFLSGGYERLEEITAVANAGDLDQLSCLAHDMVSTSGNIGALQTSCLARALARACRIGDSKAARPLLGELAIAAFASNAAIRKWLDTN